MSYSNVTQILAVVALLAAITSCQRPVGEQPSPQPLAVEPHDDLGAPQVPEKTKRIPQCSGALHFVFVRDHRPGRTRGRPDSQYVDHAYLNRLAEAYRTAYGIEAQVEAPMHLVEADFDEKRRQYQDDHILDRLTEEYGYIVGKPNAVLIGIMNADMYAKSIPEWRYAFSMRRPDQGLALISTFRMTAPPTKSGAATFGHRIRTMLAKDVGRLLCDFELNDDPRSVMYGKVLGPSDLDAMSEDLQTGLPHK